MNSHVTHRTRQGQSCAIAESALLPRDATALEALEDRLADTERQFRVAALQLHATAAENELLKENIQSLRGNIQSLELQLHAMGAKNGFLTEADKTELSKLGSSGEDRIRLWELQRQVDLVPWRAVRIYRWVRAYLPDGVMIVLACWFDALQGQSKRVLPRR